MEKVLFATIEGKRLSTGEVLQLPANSHIKIIVDTEEQATVSENVEIPGKIEVEKRQDKLIRLLESWREEEDSGEQKETWEYLKKVLDEDRLSQRRLFP